MFARPVGQKITLIVPERFRNTELMRRQLGAFAVSSVMFLVYLGCAAAVPIDTGDTEDAGDVAYDAGTAPQEDAALTIITSPIVDASVAPDAASGCADGTREGFPDQTNVAACGGTWVGDVATAVTLCATGWHVCDGSEPSIKAMTFNEAVTVAGCYALDVSDDNDDCHHGCAKAVASGVDNARDVDMGAVGALCPFLQSNHDSCLKSGRIDFTQNSGTGCNFAPGLNGVTCCNGL